MIDVTPADEDAYSRIGAVVAYVEVGVMLWTDSVIVKLKLTSWH